MINKKHTWIRWKGRQTWHSTMHNRHFIWRPLQSTHSYSPGRELHITHKSDAHSPLPSSPTSSSKNRSQYSSHCRRVSSYVCQVSFLLLRRHLGLTPFGLSLFRRSSMTPSEIWSRYACSRGGSLSSVSIQSSSSGPATPGVTLFLLPAITVVWIDDCVAETPPNDLDVYLM